MGMRFRNRMKKFITEALVACLLLAPTVLPPAGAGEGNLPGEVLTGSEQPGADDEGEDGVRPCGDLDDEVYLKNENS